MDQCAILPRVWLPHGSSFALTPRHVVSTLHFPPLSVLRKGLCVFSSQAGLTLPPFFPHFHAFFCDNFGGIVPLFFCCWHTFWSDPPCTCKPSFFGPVFLFHDTPHHSPPFVALDPPPSPCEAASLFFQRLACPFASGHHLPYKYKLFWSLPT